MTAPQGNTNDTLQGVATLDPAKRQARIILGGGAAGPEGVAVTAHRPGHLRPHGARHGAADRWSGMTGAAAQPARTLDGDVPVGTDGSITLPVTDGNQGRRAERGLCTATGARVPGKIGNALSCAATAST